MAKSTTKNTSKANPLLAQALQAKSWAEIARLLKVSGKALRAHVRSKHGVYVSKGQKMTPEVIAAVVERYTSKPSTSK